MRQPKVIIKAGEFEGSYPLRYPLTQGDWEVVFDIAAVGILEFPQEIGRANPKVIRAIETLALTQAGRVIEPGMLDDLVFERDVELDWPEPEKPEAPLVESSSSAEPESKSESVEPTGANSSAPSGISLGNVPALYSGNRGSGESFTSHRET